MVVLLGTAKPAPARWPTLTMNRVPGPLFSIMIKLGEINRSVRFALATIMLRPHVFL